MSGGIADPRATQQQPPPADPPPVGTAAEELEILKKSVLCDVELISRPIRDGVIQEFKKWVAEADFSTVREGTVDSTNLPEAAPADLPDDAPDGVVSLTLELTPEAYATLRRLASASGQPVDRVFDKALALFKASLEARRDGRHVGIAERGEALEEEFVGLGRPGGPL